MLPLQLPISPMLARAATSIPSGNYAYEPKWDGFRCIIIRDGNTIELGSRSKRPLTRYFPELIEPVRSLPERCIIDSELVVRAGEPGAEYLSWEDLSQRIHPAESRIAKLSQETPGELICFDILALDDADLTALPFSQRRELLHTIFDGHLDPRLHLTALTEDRATAEEWFTAFEGAGLDGVIAKQWDGRYEQGKRSLVKIKHKRSAEAVVVGYRITPTGDGVATLLLGMYDADGTLIRVGGIVGFPAQMRRDMMPQLEPLVLDAVDPSLTKPRSRYHGSNDDSYIPLAPFLVVEVAFDQLEGNRFRNVATFVRWRPDKDPRECLIDQVDRALSYDLADVLEA